jgi:phosphoenolpyruvate carboxykinase (ATP)
MIIETKHIEPKLKKTVTNNKQVGKMENHESKYGLDQQGLTNIGQVFWNLSTPVLYEEIIRRREGFMAHLGPIVVRTGQYTGRAAKDKFIVDEPSSHSNIWWGQINQPFDANHYEVLFHRLLAYLQGKDLFVQDCFAGADPKYRLPLRVITETAWHSLFSRNMFIRANSDELAGLKPEFTVIHVPNFHAVPSLDGTNSEAFIILNLAKKQVLIGGTSYAGEIKKAIFTVLNYLYPQENVLSMHCSANIGPKGDVALFFGLSGTGKTTLSADPERNLIGDDEHGWSPGGIFDFEGGCYAKVIGLSKTAEPDIYETTRKFGTILENVAFNSLNRRLDLDDDSLTENTRAAYPITHIPNVASGESFDHPKTVIFLTCDAFGVMPPIARLNTAQAMYHFISGYTAKLGGGESGADSSPTAAFSPCYGAPFMALHPSKYANLLEQRLKRHKVNCWLINTGWSGGPAGVGQRLKIAYSRAMVKAAMSGELDKMATIVDPIFGLVVPKTCPAVPTELMTQRNTWADKNAYDEKARYLADLFIENFREYEKDVPAEVAQAGPKLPE